MTMVVKAVPLKTREYRFPRMLWARAGKVKSDHKRRTEASQGDGPDDESSDAGHDIRAVEDVVVGWQATVSTSQVAGGVRTCRGDAPAMLDAKEMQAMVSTLR